MCPYFYYYIIGQLATYQSAFPATPSWLPILSTKQGGFYRRLKAADITLLRFIMHRFQAYSQNFEMHLLISLCLTVRLSAWDKLAPTGRIFTKFDI
jgi:hypothetical protein